MFSHDPFRVEFHDAYMKKQTTIIISVDQKHGKCEIEVGGGGGYTHNP